MTHSITAGDVVSWARDYRGPKFHALLSDPPYHLASIVKRFGKSSSAPAQGGVYNRSARGFMGQTWDGGNVAFDPETWAALAEHLHDGAFGMAFAGSRGWHRMAVAIEDAGLLIHPTIFCWAYGSGFPKATQLSSQIDDQAFRFWLTLVENSAAREQLDAWRLKVRECRAAHKLGGTAETRAALTLVQRGYKERYNAIKTAAGFLRPAATRKQTGAKFGLTEQLIANGGYNDPERDEYTLADAITPLARAWAEHRYGAQALKPAVEPIIVFQKPYSGKPLARITTTGAGALNIGAGRIGTSRDVPASLSRNKAGLYDLGVGGGILDDLDPNVGRWPANLALVHHPACNGHCHADCAVRRLGEQSGEDATRASVRKRAGSHIGLLQGTESWAVTDDNLGGYDDSGTAARYFYNGDYMYERIELADVVRYEAKASRAEREAGLDPRQIRLLDDMEAAEQFDETTVTDGRDKAIDNAFQRGQTKRRNVHPTIKPIALNRWLASLLLPPDEYQPRRLLVPFSGAGSEMIGAMLAGWDDMHGVELHEKHVRLAEARLAYWQQRRHELLDPSTPITAQLTSATADQLELF